MTSRTQRTPLTSVSGSQPRAGAHSSSTASKVSLTAAAAASTARTRPTAARSTAVAPVKTAAPAATASAAPLSVAALIQRDKQRARSAAARSSEPAAPASTRLAGLLSHAGLAEHLHAKTLQDEAWSQAQEQRFIAWINTQIVGHAAPHGQSSHSVAHALDSIELSRIADSMRCVLCICMAAIQAEPLIPDALYSRYRSAGLQLFHAREMQSTLFKVDTEIDAGRIGIQLRASRLGDDVEQRHALQKMLLSNVSSFWLRLGCEVVSGFELPRASGGGKVSDLLAQFLSEILFPSANNTILPRPSSAIESTVSGMEHMDAEHRARSQLAAEQTAAKNTLKKLLHLLLFVDRAKMQNITGRPSASSSANSAATAAQGGPPLFRASSEYRSVSSLLQHVSQRFLNEGDLLRHLSFLGFTLHSEDRAQDMVDFSVRNLAVDLRDGVRLVKLIECLLQTSAAHAIGTRAKGGVALLNQPVELVSQLRLPADTEAKKMHNINVALNALYASSSSSPRSAASAAAASAPLAAARVSAQDIMSGNQLQTYMLCWQLLVRFDVQSLVSTRELQQEVARIQRAHSQRGQSNSLLMRQQEQLYFGPSEKLNNLLTWVQTLMWAQACLSARSGASSSSSSGQLLIANFTTSFRSGVALCLILNYYFPSLMPLSDIAYPVERKDKLAWGGEEHLAAAEEKSAVETATGADENNGANSGWVGAFSCKDIFAQKSQADHPDFLAARSNFSLLAARLKSLSGQREMGDCFSSLLDSALLFPAGFGASAAGCNGSPIPDEKGIVSFLSFLASRLLILSEEIHAAKSIQAAIRRFLLRTRKRRALAEKKRQAAEQLAALAAKQQALARVRAAQEAEVQAIQSKRAAQAAKRAADELLKAQRAEQHRIQMEAAIAAEVAARQREMERARVEQEEYLRQMAAEEAAQAAEQFAMEHAERVDSAVLILQSAFRGVAARRAAQRLREARAHKLWSAACCIQRAYACSKARAQLYVRKEEAAARIRTAREAAAVRLQQFARCCAARLVLQSLRKAEAARQLQVLQHRSAIIIQCMVRCHMARTEHYLRAEAAHAALQRRHAAATIIQCMVRCSLARHRLCTLRLEHHIALERARCREAAAVCLQTRWRGVYTRAQFAIMKQRTVSACIVLQSAYRGMLARRLYNGLRRQIQAARELQALHEKSALTIQCAARVRAARIVVAQVRAVKLAAAAEAARRLTAVVVLQSAWRALQARRSVTHLAQLKRERIALEQARLAALRAASATTLQCAFRCSRARAELKHLRAERHARVASAICIQTHIRAYHARRMLAELQEQQRQRQHARQLLERQSVTAIQCAVRSFFARRQLHTLRAQKREADALAFQQRTAAALKIQCAARSSFARRQRLQLAEQRRVTLEAAREAHVKRECAALVAQRAFRCFITRRTLAALRHAERTRVALLNARRNSAAIMLQSSFRRHRAIAQLAQLKAAQAEKQRQARKLAACITLQAHARGRQARIIASEMSAAREKLRAADAEFQVALAQAQREKAQVVALRSWAAGRLARRVAAAWKHYSTHNAAFLRRKHAKLHSAATHMQRLVRGFLARREATHRRAAIVSLQSHWRGRASRRSLQRALRLRLGGIEKKLRLAGRNVSEGARVGTRTRSALETLLGGQSLSGVLEAMQTLDRTTALLSSCCVDAVRQNALPALFAVLRSLNRSKPHLLLLEATLNVFWNLARERSTRSALLVDAGAQLVDCFTDALQSYTGSPTIVLKLTRVLQMGLNIQNLTVRTGSADAAASASASAATIATRAPLRAFFAAGASALKRVQGVSNLLERKLAVELKASARKGPVASSSASSTTSLKRARAGVAAAVAHAVAFDQHWCVCHGSISSAAPANAAEKIAHLQACCEHVSKLLQAAQAP